MLHQTVFEHKNFPTLDHIINNPEEHILMFICNSFGGATTPHLEYLQKRLPKVYNAYQWYCKNHNVLGHAICINIKTNYIEKGYQDNGLEPSKYIMFICPTATKYCNHKFLTNTFNDILDFVNQSKTDYLRLSLSNIECLEFQNIQTADFLNTLKDVLDTRTACNEIWLDHVCYDNIE